MSDGRRWALLVDWQGVLVAPDDRHGPDGPGGPEGVLAMVRRARAAGVRTALVSNSSGDWSESFWRGAFDVEVVSGRTGLGKPDPAVYRHTARALGIDVSRCVMVDDSARNVAGAVAVGMVGVLHRDPATTRTELEAVLDLDLGPTPAG